MMLRTITLAALASASTLAAQETSGRLHGRVLTGAHVTLPGATVALSGPALQTPRLLRVNPQGYFVAYALPPGEYRVHVRALGHRELIVEQVAVALGTSTSLGELTLTRSEVLLDPIVVRYDATALDPLSTEVASRLDVRLAERLPVGRDYQSIVMLLPQVHQGLLHREGLNIGGGTGLENAYYIDGVNVTEGYRNSGGINLPPSFIDQVEVKVGGYEAEFGRALGGIVSLTTRSGTDTHEASAFSYFTASSLSSSTTRASSDLATGRFSRYDAGVALGGPVLRDRLWYFAAYDAGFATEHVRLPGGTQVDRARADQFAGKLTWRADDRTNVNATIVGDPSRRDLVGHSFWGALPITSLANADPHLGYWDGGNIAASLAANRTIGTHTLLEASASWGASRDRTGPRTSIGATEPIFIDFVTGEWSGGYGNMWDRRSTRTAVSFAATYETGPHNFKAGIQYEDNRQNENWHWIRTSVGGLGLIMRSAPDQYLGGWLDHVTRTSNRIPTVYAQTSLQLHDRFRLNPGLRWEAQYFHSPNTGRSGSITDQWQPRIGAILYPTAARNDKVTASIGRFYEQIPNLPITWYWGGLHQDVNIYDVDPRTNPATFIPIAWDFLPQRGIKGQHFDELTLGYDRRLGRAMSLSARVSRRRMREILVEAPMPGDPSKFVLANPGRGEFAPLGEPVSRYDALELSLGRMSSARRAFMLTYVLSKKFGNYVGLFDQDVGNPNAHAPGISVSGGLLPNDRTHVFKALGVFRASRLLTIGGTAAVQSGTPLSELAALAFNPTVVQFLSPRGSAGRTPALWDLSLRGNYSLPGYRSLRDARLVVDVMHAFSQRKPLRLNQVQYLSVDAAGNPTDPNPFYGSGIQFQPPMTLRLGVEIGVASSRDRP